jgi:hypothetical protein
VAWDSLDKPLHAADIVVTATGASEPVLTRARIEEAMRPRRGRALFIIDIALPRDVESTAGDLEQVILYNIDDLQATSLRVDGSGALKAEIAGRVDDEHVSISGAVNYRAERLRATNATVSVSGVANVVVHAERKLRASISGAGLIEYVGDPEVTEHVSGMGRVKRRDSSVMPGMRVA